MKEFEALKEELKKTQVIILAGGSAQRMGFALQDTPKAMIKLAGKPLIDHCIEFYRDCGFQDFILLLGHKHEKIEEYVSDGSKYGIRIKYCIDPEPKMGKGKALRAAINKIDKSKRAFISYPDDIFFDKTLPLRLLLHHMDGVKRQKIIATILFVSATKHPFGVAEINDYGLAESFLEKPMIRKFSSTGVALVEPEFFKIVERCIDLNEKGTIELESVVYPEIARMKKLYSMIIPPDLWLPVNTLKEFEIAEKILSKKLSNF